MYLVPTYPVYTLQSAYVGVSCNSDKFTYTHDNLTVSTVLKVRFFLKIRTTYGRSNDF